MIEQIRNYVIFGKEYLNSMENVMRGVNQETNIVLDSILKFFETKLVEGDQYQIIDQEINEISKMSLFTLHHLEKIFINEPVSKYTSDFIEKYCTLIFFWNDNNSKIEELRHKCLLVDRFFKLQLTSIEVIEILKISISRINTSIINPIPQINLSRYYLDSFDRNELLKNKALKDCENG